MNLRIARKIVKAIGTPDGDRYSEGQKLRALSRTERTRESREADTFWHALMAEIGVAGRAEVLAGSGAPGMALGLLMRSPEDEWAAPPAPPCSRPVTRAGRRGREGEEAWRPRRLRWPSA